MKTTRPMRDFNLHNVTHIVMGHEQVPVTLRGTDFVIGPWPFPVLPTNAQWAGSHMRINGKSVPLARFPVKGAVLIRSQPGSQPVSGAKRAP